MRRTKIICTLGPSTRDPAVLRALMEAGMDVARLNFSHGDHVTHRRDFETVRSLAQDLGRNVAIMMDLQGPKIRTGKLAGGVPISLENGAELRITTEDVEGDPGRIATSYEPLPRDVVPGDRILLADGALELRVEAVGPSEVSCRVIHGGLLGEHKGINLPGIKVSAPSLTPKDLEDLAFGVGLGVDFVALSFVRSANDIRELKAHIQRLLGGGTGAGQAVAHPPAVVAKFERPEALENAEAILEQTDAVMVARGDLGIEMDLQEIPQVQKSLIFKCNARGIPVITATQMLESMMANARPTRAEVTDVANAIYDGTDAVMLSGETAVGQFPLEAVRTMAGIAAKTDAAIAALARDARQAHEPAVWPGSHSGAIGEAVHHMLHSMGITRIVCFTQSGYSARAIARYRPRIPLTAITLSEKTLRQCALIWGVEALRNVELAGFEEMVRAVDALLLEHRLARPGETIVIIAGTPLAVGGVTNLLHLHEVGQPD